jgi:flavorubredoxin
MGTGATWISSKRRAYHVYAGHYELDESPVVEIGERAEDAGIVGDSFWAEQLLVYLFASGHVSIDEDQGTVVDTTHRDTTLTTTLFFLTRRPA